MEPAAGGLRNAAQRGEYGFGKEVYLMGIPLARMRDPILILIDLGLAPQTKATPYLIVAFIVSERRPGQNTLFKFFEHGMRNLHMSKRFFIRSVLCVALAVLGEHKSLWRGSLDDINRQRIA